MSEQDASAPARRYQEQRIRHWDQVAQRWQRLSTRDRWQGAGGYYQRHLQKIYRFLVPPGQRVLELGCGLGDLLAALRPATGVGVDFSPVMIQHARERHPELHFVLSDVHTLTQVVQGEFDAILLSDLVNDLWDVQAVLEQVAQLCQPQTRVILNTYSRLWEIPLKAAQGLRLAKPNLYQNWLTVEDLQNLLYLCGLETIRHWQEFLFPVPVPLLAPLANRYLARLWPFHQLDLTNFFVARLRPERSPGRTPARVSVIIPARNEAGNIEAIFSRLPEMGAGTELIFVEGHSRDDTAAAIQQAIARHPERRCRLLQQSGIGKGDAVRQGFAAAEGDILMILDADLTVPPEDLPRFYQALHSGAAEFVNGVRLVYPMEKQAMRFLNLVGNKFFSLAFSFLLGQPVKDTLCGTKALWRQDYERIAANRDYFGDFDPFGDFDLLFGAARLNLKIVDLPVRYRERVYGTTNIQRWKHGWLLLKMVMFAAGRLKFI